MNDISSIESTPVCGFEVLTAACKEIADKLIMQIENGFGGWVLTLNLEMIARAAKDPSYKLMTKNIRYAVADGMPIVWASKIPALSTIHGRTTGVELCRRLLQWPSVERIALIGGANPNEVAGRFIPAPSRSFLVIDGEIRFCEETVNDIVAQLKEHRTQLALIALGVPKQDYFANAIIQHCPHITVIGVGSSLDVLAGIRSPAPEWLQNAGLEWLFRLLTETRHVWKRYLLRYPYGAFSLLGYLLRRKVLLSRSREESFLLYCLSQAVSSGPIVAKANSDIDWQTFKIIAEPKNLLPQLSKVLSAYKRFIPGTLQEEIQHLLIQNIRHNSILTSELITLTEAFRSHAIRFIGFKGPILAFSLYDSLSSRVFNDLDILIEYEDLPKTHQLLKELGYTLNVSYSWQQTFISVSSQKGLTVIDVHWQLTSFPKFPFKLPLLDSFWPNRTPVTISADCSVFTFSVQDNCIVLAIQVMRGCYEGKPSLRQLCDFAKALNVFPISDWPELLQEVERLNVVRPFFLAIGLVQHFISLDFALPIPAFYKTHMNIPPRFLVYINGLLFKEHPKPLLTKIVMRIYARYILKHPPVPRILVLPYLLWESLICSLIYTFRRT